MAPGEVTSVDSIGVTLASEAGLPLGHTHHTQVIEYGRNEELAPHTDCSNDTNDIGATALVYLTDVVCVRSWLSESAVLVTYFQYPHIMIILSFVCVFTVRSAAKPLGIGPHALCSQGLVGSPRLLSQDSRLPLGATQGWQSLVQELASALSFDLVRHLFDTNRPI